MPCTLKVQRSLSLPREIFDLIITNLISLHAHDPAYQWTTLRSITRFHKRELEHHFLYYWLPKLSISVYADDLDVHYAASGLKKRSGLACFKVKKGWDNLQHNPSAFTTWKEEIMMTTFPVGDEAYRGQSLIMRVGEGVLSRGFAGGHIISDVLIPRLEVDETATTMWFDWKALFSKIFGEEMLMRRLRDKFLEQFVPTIRATRPTTRHAAIHAALRKKHQLQRRVMLRCFRDHIASSDTPFDITPFLDRAKPRFHPGIKPYPPFILDILKVEESMIHSVPGWDSWNIREIALLRAEEEASLHNFFPCERTLRPDPLQQKLDRWRGKVDVNEELLEEELKAIKRWNE